GLLVYETVEPGVEAADEQDLQHRGEGGDEVPRPELCGHEGTREHGHQRHLGDHAAERLAQAVDHGVPRETAKLRAHQWPTLRVPQYGQVQASGAGGSITT